jgi:toxin ParE1/3/4
LTIQGSVFFIEDFYLQAEWYATHANDEVAYRWLAAVETLLLMLATQPGVGRVRQFRHRELAEMRSFRVNPPFDKYVVFYRFNENTLYAERIVHGARDLPRRLLQRPGTD